MTRAFCVSIVLAVSGCGGDGRDGDTTSVVTDGVERSGSPRFATTSSELRWRRDAYRELDADEENPERLIATVSKGTLDSTIVRLEIRTSKDGLLYRHEWPATLYMKYGPPGSAKDTAAVLRETERQLVLIFADSAFIRGAAAPGFAGKAESDLDAIRYDIAEHEYRASKGLKRWVPLPRGAYDELNTFARAVPGARIQAVASETRDKPAFRYYAGGEETYVVAWSPTEKRMVRIAACC